MFDRVCGQTTPVVAGQGFVQRPGLVVSVGGLFISGPVTPWRNQDLGAEDLLPLFEVAFRKTVEGPVWAKQSVGDHAKGMTWRCG